MIKIPWKELFPKILHRLPGISQDKYIWFPSEKWQNVRMDCTSTVQVCLGGKRGKRAGTHTNGDSCVRIWEAVCSLVHLWVSVGWFTGSSGTGSPYIHVAKTERAASEPCLLILMPGCSLPSGWPQQSGHPWQSWPISSCLQRQVAGRIQLPKGEVASATGDGINNWDVSMGIQRDDKYGLWEPFWNSSQRLVGIPPGCLSGTKVLWLWGWTHPCGMCQQGKVGRRNYKLLGWGGFVEEQPLPAKEQWDTKSQECFMLCWV